MMARALRAEEAPLHPRLSQALPDLQDRQAQCSSPHLQEVLINVPTLPCIQEGTSFTPKILCNSQKNKVFHFYSKANPSQNTHGKRPSVLSKSLQIQRQGFPASRPQLDPPES